MSQPRIIFAGSPDFAATHLQALIDAGFNIVAVYSQRDKKTGRGHKLQATPVKSLALEHNIEVYTPVSFKEEGAIETLQSLNADLMIVVAYGLILPQAVLDAPRLGCINVHGSLLPAYRGAAPIQRALLDGQSETGITLMQMSLGLDEGDMLAVAKLKIEDNDTSESLFEKLASVGSDLLVKSLPKILQQTLKAEPQDSNLANYAAKLSKDESPLNFEHDYAALDRQVRALYSWPLATITIEGETYKILKAQGKACEHNEILGCICKLNKHSFEIACKGGCLVIESIQAPGKAPVDAGIMARNRPLIFSLGRKVNAQ